jgi:hypothetical protein
MQFVDVVFNTPGVGGLVAGSVISILIVCYGLTVRWISKGEENSAER